MLSKTIIEQIKKSIVFMGTFVQDEHQRRRMNPTATGFLITINDAFHLVTAKHVVFDSKKDSLIDDNLFVFLNSTDGKIQARAIDIIKNTLHRTWIFHPNRDVDVAIIPFPVIDGQDDIKVIPDKYFQTPDELFENLDVFFLSYQPSKEIKQKISPILRRGAISRMNEDTTFYIDAAAFPGNSGSPVFLSPSMMLQETGQYSVSAGANFVGLIGESLQYTDYAISVQTGLPRVAFQESTGLSKVWSVGFINEIIESQAFKQQVSKMPPGPEQ